MASQTYTTYTFLNPKLLEKIKTQAREGGGKANKSDQAKKKKGSQGRGGASKPKQPPKPPPPLVAVKLGNHVRIYMCSVCV